jgi:membrane protein DedA with SNARE-associated domain
MDDVPHLLEGLAGSPWLLVIVFAVAGLDAMLPFMPSESTVVALGVLSAGTGRPQLALLILAAATGAYAGDRLSYQIGRSSNRAVIARLQRGRRSKLVHDWVHRLLSHRGRLVIVFARYVPGGRSTTAFAAGVVGYPLGRFRRYTAIAVLLWAIEAALLGYLGGAAFAAEPLVGLAVAWAAALAITGVAVLIQRLVHPTEATAPVSSAEPTAPTSPAVPGIPDRAATPRPPVP